MDVTELTELALNISDIIKSIPDVKYEQFSAELAKQMDLRENEQIESLRNSINSIRES